MYETIFSFSGLIGLPFWALMILAPGWTGTYRIIRSPLIALPPALLYVALVLPGIRESFPVLLNPTLEEIARLLGQPEGATRTRNSPSSIVRSSSSTAGISDPG